MSVRCAEPLDGTTTFPWGRMLACGFGNRWMYLPNAAQHALCQPGEGLRLALSSNDHMGVEPYARLDNAHPSKAARFRGRRTSGEPLTLGPSSTPASQPRSSLLPGPCFAGVSMSSSWSDTSNKAPPPTSRKRLNTCHNHNKGKR